MWHSSNAQLPLATPTDGLVTRICGATVETQFVHWHDFSEVSSWQYLTWDQISSTFLGLSSTQVCLKNLQDWHKTIFRSYGKVVLYLSQMGYKIKVTFPRVLEFSWKRNGSIQGLFSAANFNGIHLTLGVVELMRKLGSQTSYYRQLVPDVNLQRNLKGTETNVLLWCFGNAHSSHL